MWGGGVARKQKGRTPKECDLISIKAIVDYSSTNSSVVSSASSTMLMSGITSNNSTSK